MCSSEARARVLPLAAALVLLGGPPGCATTLPGGDLSMAAGSDDAGASPPLAPGCLPFLDVPGLSALSGGLRSIRRPGGDLLFIADQATVAGASVPSLALAAPPDATVDDCLAGASPSGGASTPALDPPALVPLAGVSTGAGALLYFVDPSGATGVAAEDGADGRFRPVGALLWSSDRPSYGTAAAVVGDQVETVGCEAARYLDADCFLARAPLLTPGDESAYAYDVGNGAFSPRVDDAWPMTTGAGSFDLALAPGGERWILVYAPPLGRRLVVRSALAPQGPWSAPIPIATCDLADPDMFCGAIHLHPEVRGPAGTMVVSYAPISLSADAPARRAAAPRTWWPRVAALALPPLP